MSYNERRSRNTQLIGENQLKEKFLNVRGKGLSALHPAEKSGFVGNFLPNRSPFIFIPRIPSFAGPSLPGPASVIESIQRIYNILQQFPLALEVPPQSVSYNYDKRKNVEVTLSGYVEWHWGDNLDSIQANMTTGVFLNPQTGLADGPDRRASYSYINYENLLGIYQNNGAFYDSFGKVMLFSGLSLINDMGIFQGFFESFSVNEVATNPFNFKVSWAFKVEKVIHLFADLTL